MARRIAASIQSLSVSDNTWTLLLSSKANRRQLAFINEAGTDFHVAFQETTPVSIDEGIKLADDKAFFEDEDSGIHITSIFVFQNSGAPATIKFWEE